jgi:hypothetical protein
MMGLCNRFATGKNIQTAQIMTLESQPVGSRSRIRYLSRTAAQPLLNGNIHISQFRLIVFIYL